MHLGELLWGEQPVSARRFTALVEGLSPKGALHRAMRPEDWYWDNDSELRALLIETVDALDVHFVRANFKDGDKAKPIKVPRPYKQESKRKGTTLAEFKQLMRGN